MNPNQGNQQISIQKIFFYENYLSKATWDDFTNNYETSRRLDLIFNRLIKPAELAGKSLLDAELLSVLFLGGLQLIRLDVIGEYLDKMSIGTKNRPAYIIKEKDL